MAYELVINRVMALCALEVASKQKDEQLKGKALVKLFHAQMEDIFKHRLAPMYSELEKKLKAYDLKRQGENERVAELEVDIFKEGADSDEYGSPVPAGSNSRPTERLVGRFQSRRFHFKTKSLKWDLRVRPSVTACAVERLDGIAKLWFAFEGVPADPASAQRPSGNEAVEFMNATNEMAAVALPLLRTAYAASLDAVTDRAASTIKPVDGHIQVSIADNNGLPFAKLVDAMFLKGASFADVRKGIYGEETAKGANEFVTFIQKASGRTPDDSSVEINTDLPGKAAVFCRFQDVTSATGKDTFVAGLANSASMISAEINSTKEWRRAENKPELLRSVSAARPISAVIANERAKILDRELPGAMLAPG